MSFVHLKKNRTIQMKKIQLTLTLVVLLAGKSFAQPAHVINEYVSKFKDIAIDEMKRTGVPAAKLPFK